MGLAPRLALGGDPIRVVNAALRCHVPLVDFTDDELEALFAVHTTAARVGANVPQGPQPFALVIIGRAS
jgi:hypothetical protein